jgi:hypothetical protein
MVCIITIMGEYALMSKMKSFSPRTERLDLMKDKKTSIQISPETRDRLYRLKFRKTYEQFLSELCDMYEERELEGDIKR